jgi:hypothetical protein
MLQKTMDKNFHSNINTSNINTKKIYSREELLKYRDCVKTTFIVPKLLSLPYEYSNIERFLDFQFIYNVRILSDGKSSKIAEDILSFFRANFYYPESFLELFACIGRTAQIVEERFAVYEKIDYFDTVKSQKLLIKRFLYLMLNKKGIRDVSEELWEDFTEDRNHFESFSSHMKRAFNAHVEEYIASIKSNDIGIKAKFIFFVSQFVGQDRSIKTLLSNFNSIMVRDNKLCFTAMKSYERIVEDLFNVPDDEKYYLVDCSRVVLRIFFIARKRIEEIVDVNFFNSDPSLVLKIKEKVSHYRPLRC